MKNYFFQKGLFVSLLLCYFQGFSQSQVVLTYPLNNSVFQKNANGSAAISFAGQVLKGSFLPLSVLNSQTYLQIEQYSYTTKQWSFSAANF